MSEERGMPRAGVLCGIAAAALFGSSAPLAKALLPGTGPLVLAGLLYLGAGLGLSSAALLPSADRLEREARLHRTDTGHLIGIVVLGGIVGPLLMLYGLGRTSGVAGSLLLNLEAPFTILLAVLVFKEHLGTRGTAAALLVVAGALVLTYDSGDLRAHWLGVLAIAGACLSWAIDNNLTQRLSLRDPIVIVRIKALGPGACMLGLAFVMGHRLPKADVLVSALAVGVVCYGVSLVLDVYALRLLGAAREAAFFATAPFVGALVALPLLDERPTRSHLLSALLMGGGVLLLLRERHGHVHAHEELEHDHTHVHDEHHRHEHASPGPVLEPHTHPHRHVPLLHDHPHVPDLHHRHRH